MRLAQWQKLLFIKPLLTPYIDHCSSIMLNYSAKMIDKLQKVQNRALRLVLGVNV